MFPNIFVFEISHLASGILRILLEYIKTKNSLDSKLQNDSICSFGHLSFLEVKNGKMLNPELRIKNSLVPSCGCQISCLDPLASCRAMAATSCSANKLSTNRILLRLNVTLRLCEMEKGDIPVGLRSTIIVTVELELKIMYRYA